MSEAGTGPLSPSSLNGSLSLSSLNGSSGAWCCMHLHATESMTTEKCLYCSLPCYLCLKLFKKDKHDFNFFDVR